eukprot:gene43528-33666_t
MVPPPGHGFFPLHDDGTHACGTGGGRVCNKDGTVWSCGCAAGWVCTGNCDAQQEAHQCAEITAPK